MTEIELSTQKQMLQMIQEMTKTHQGKPIEFQNLMKRLTLDRNKQGSMMETELPTHLKFQILIRRLTSKEE